MKKKTATFCGTKTLIFHNFLITFFNSLCFQYGVSELSGRWMSAFKVSRMNTFDEWLFIVERKIEIKFFFHRKERWHEAMLLKKRENWIKQRQNRLFYSSVKYLFRKWNVLPIENDIDFASLENLWNTHIW